MNAVDQFDQNIAYYAFNRKTVKWRKRALTHLLHVAIIQSMLLYCIKSKKNVSQFSFTVDLIREMTKDIPRLRTVPTVDPAGGSKKTGPPLPKTDTPLTPPHPLERKASAQYNCLVCTVMKKRKKGDSSTKREYLHHAESRYECRECGGVALFCVDTCFEIYHEYTVYKKKIRAELNITDNE